MNIRSEKENHKRKNTFQLDTEKKKIKKNLLIQML